MKMKLLPITVKREFEEEALNTNNDQVKSELNQLWKNGKIISEE